MTMEKPEATGQSAVGRQLPVMKGRNRPKADIRDYQTDALKLALIFSAFFLPFKPRERHK